MHRGHTPPPNPSRPSHVVPTEAEIAAVSALLARVGLERTVETLGIGRHTVERVRGGLPVHRGTLLAVRMALATFCTGEPQS